jgi:hypothetical protein
MNNPSEHGPTPREQTGRHDMGRHETGRTEQGSTMGAVKEKAQEWGQSVASGAQQAWDATQRQTREWASNVAETAENAWEGMGNTIRRYPVASLLIALGVGFILGGGLGMTARRNSWS